MRADLVDSDQWFGCSDSEDCSAGCACSGSFLSGECVPGCKSNDDCPAGHFCPGQLCFLGCGAAPQCAPGCHDDTECAAGQVCSQGTCAEGCRDDKACSGGQICAGSQCLEGYRCRQDSDCQNRCTTDGGTMTPDSEVACGTGLCFCLSEHLCAPDWVALFGSEPCTDN